MKRAKKHVLKVTVPLPPPRNPYARSPLMKKGGVHEASSSAKRGRAKRELERQLKQVDGDA